MLGNIFKNSSEKSVQRFSDFFLGSVLFISGMKYTFQLEHFVDIGLYDESIYLNQGVNLLNLGLPDSQYGPIYSIWYFFLSLFQKNNIALYFLNLKLLSWFIPVLLYLVLRKYRVSQLLSLILAFFYLISLGNIFVWPKVSHFCLGFILLMFLWVSEKNDTEKLTYFAMTALVVSYVRPEFFLSFIGFLVIFVWKVIQKPHRVLFRKLTTMLIFSLFLIVILGLPIAGNRNFVAFGQHFSLNWVHWTNSNLDPWLNWEEIIALNFGPSETTAQAFLYRPELILKHIGTNLSRSYLLLIFLFTYHSNVFFPPEFKDVEVKLLVLFLCMYALIGSFLKFKKLGRDWVEKGKQKIKQQSIFYIGIGVFMLPSYLATLIIYPREHYLVILGILAVLGIAIFVFGEAKPKTVIRNFEQTMLVGLVLIAITPQISFYSGNEGTLPVSGTLHFLNALDFQEDINLLEVDGGYHIYLGENYHRVENISNYSNCLSLLRGEDVTMIIGSQRLIQYTDALFEGGCNEFWENYLDFGFQKITVPDSRQDIYVSK